MIHKRFQIGLLPEDLDRMSLPKRRGLMHWANQNLSHLLALTPFCDRKWLNLIWGLLVAGFMGSLDVIYAEYTLKPLHQQFCKSVAGNCTFYWSVLIDFLIFSTTVTLCPLANFMAHDSRKQGLKLIRYVEKVLSKPENMAKVETIGFFFYFYLFTLFILDLTLNYGGDLGAKAGYALENGFVYMSDVYFLTLVIDFFAIAWSFQHRFKLIDEQVFLLLFPKRGPTRPLPTVSSQLHETASKRFDRLIDLHWYLCQSVAFINKAYAFKLGMLLTFLFFRLLIIPHIMSILITNAEGGLFTSSLWFIYHSCQLALLVLPAADSARNADRLMKTICEGLGNTGQLTEDQMLNTLPKLSVHFASFSAFNTLALKRRLISSIVGAISTYLIVLTQLKSTNISADGDTGHAA